MTMETSEEIRLLREIAKWTREAAIPNVKARVERLLDSDAKKRAYAAMDGTVGFVAIEKATGANHTDVKNWLQGWEKEGIVEPGTNPPKAVFTLVELGIEAPPPKATRTKKA